MWLKVITVLLILVLLFQYFLRLWFFSGASDTVSFVTKSCEPDKPAPAKLVRFLYIFFLIPNWFIISIYYVIILILLKFILGQSNQNEYQFEMECS